MTTTLAYEPFVKSNYDLSRLLDGWLIKYDPSQARDERGRWTSTGVSEPSVPWHSAAARVAGRLAGVAGTTANVLDSVTTIRSATDLITIGREVDNITGHLRVLLAHLREAPEEFKTLGRETKRKLQDARDHLLIIRDHLDRLQATARGDAEHARQARHRINLRRRIMHMRRAGVSA
jgi:hypothetical protein